MPFRGEYLPFASEWVREQVETYEATGGREATTRWLHHPTRHGRRASGLVGPSGRRVPADADSARATDRGIPVFVATPVGLD